jgi:hypothetical protein
LRFILVQELKDRKKIRYLLSVAKIDEDEITYFKKYVDKRFVKEMEQGEKHPPLPEVNNNLRFK